LDRSVYIAQLEGVGEVNLDAGRQRQFSPTGQDTFGNSVLPFLIPLLTGADDLHAPVPVLSPASRNQPQFQQMNFGLMASDLSVLEDPLFLNSMGRPRWFGDRF
jgi:hypothetical protein